MTFPSGGSVFDEELQCLKLYFEKWSHCERAIAVCSMLKQFQYPTLRFIHSKIEATYAQSTDCDKNKRMEQQSNDKSYIYELCDSYKKLTNINSDVQLNNNNKDSIYYESDRLIIGDNNSTNLINSNTINNNKNNNYSNNNANSTSINVNLVADKFSMVKEEILKKILNCILMLKIGNDDVIQEYLAVIPYMVDDTERRIINVRVVMQTLSILVAHPALSSDDLRTVKEHIERLKKIIQEQNVQLQYPDCKAVVRPMFSSHCKNPANNIFSSLSSFGSSQIHNDNMYDTQSDYIETDSGSAGRSSGGGSDLQQYVTSFSSKAYPSDDMFSNVVCEDQNNSFSKNGTEILDYPEYHEFNVDQPMYQKMEPACPFTNLNKLNPQLFDCVKTRRSNSLTTYGLKHNDAFLGLGLSDFTSSTENLSHLHKPRRCSLSIENPRLMMTSSGSETRLDDLKPAYQTFQMRHIGMKYVYTWLKRLRLHKYFPHFEHLTYEQMMDTTDESLEKLGITKGARNKLVIYIQKLKERSSQLAQYEQELKNGETTPDMAIEFLLETVETPMKPMEVYDTADVTVQFMNLLNVVCKIMVSKQIGPQDEESVKHLTTIFDIARLNNTEPFLLHANELRELRYEIDVLRLKFPPSQYHKNISGSANGNSNKPRWSSSTKLQSKTGSENKPHRKNSNPMSNFNFGSMQQVQKQAKSQHLGSKSKPTQQRPSRQSEFNNNYNPTPTSSYSKSSSYPNFGSNGNSATSSNGGGQQNANVGNQNATPQLHHSYHRHSVSNLITITPVKTTVTITPTAPITQKTSSCIGLHLSSQSTPHSSLSNSSSNSTTTPITSSSILPTMNYCSHQCSTELTPVSTISTISRSSSTGGGSYPKQAANKHLLGDISPYRDLEFLSLQMTEQAIN